jgi:hypothetical protein
LNASDLTKKIYGTDKDCIVWKLELHDCSKLEVDHCLHQQLLHLMPRRTLHDFFPAKPVSTQLQGKSQKLGGSKSNRRTTSTKTSSEQEVIVIDSDSDDVLEIVEGSSSFHKRRKLSARNSTDLVGFKGGNPNGWAQINSFKRESRSVHSE